MWVCVVCPLTSPASFPGLRRCCAGQLEAAMCVRACVACVWGCVVPTHLPLPPLPGLRRCCAGQSEAAERVRGHLQRQRRRHLPGSPHRVLRHSHRCHTAQCAAPGWWHPSVSVHPSQFIPFPFPLSSLPHCSTCCPPYSRLFPPFLSSLIVSTLLNVLCAPYFSSLSFFSFFPHRCHTAQRSVPNISRLFPPFLSSPLHRLTLASLALPLLLLIRLSVLCLSLSVATKSAAAPQAVKRPTHHPQEIRKDSKFCEQDPYTSAICFLAFLSFFIGLPAPSVRCLVCHFCLSFFSWVVY